MTDMQYRCGNEGRRNAVRAAGTLNGIDYLEVASADQKTLKVFFLFPLPGEADGVPAGPALGKDNVAIEGGERIRSIRALSVSASGAELTVVVNAAGDFSTYRLRIVTSPTDPAPPPGIDPRLAAVDFSFKATCPSDFDCRTDRQCEDPPPPEPDINYLAKDYASFRRLILDRLSTIMPDWRERSPADPMITMVELLAHAGDQLSYFQDAVATEAYLGTARSRRSLRRHARLLDYFVHDGCNARTWACFTVEAGSEADGAVLPRGTPVLTRGGDGRPAVPPSGLAAALRPGTPAFETMADLTLRAAHNEIAFHTWSDSECCLPKGATRAAFANDPPLSLAEGDLLLLEETVSPETGLASDADPRHRHVVRLTGVETVEDPLDGTPVVVVEWHEHDALPFPLRLSATVSAAGGAPEVVATGVARANIVPADHGITVTGRQPVPEVVGTGRYRPRLPEAGIGFAEPYDDAQARLGPASRLLVQSPDRALPLVRLMDADETWVPVRDLLGSDRFAAEFVVETERDGTAHLRFGDGTLGKKPTTGSSFSSIYRLGNGPSGNIGAGALARVVTDLDGILRVANPMAAFGGTAPETMEEVRQFAPQAFRVQQRAVTEADYAEAAARHPEVQRAAARIRWTGSWYTVYVTIDRKGGAPVEEDPVFVEAMQAHLDRFRMAGYDIEIRGPIHVPLDLQIAIRLKPGYFEADVRRALLDVFASRDLGAGRRGFFHPDNYTFGQPVYLSAVYAAAMSVDGVASAEIGRFQRWGQKPNQEIARGVLVPASLEVIRLDNDPSFPERGRLDLRLAGGL
jgi:hypothetical protein